MNGKFVRLPAVLFLMAGTADAQQPREWAIHAPDRPQPAVVDPGAGALPVPPPKAPTNNCPEPLMVREPLEML